MPANIIGPKIMHPPVAKPPVAKKAKNIPKKESISAIAPWTPSHPNHITPIEPDITTPRNTDPKIKMKKNAPIVKAHVVFQGTTTHSCHGIQKHQHPIAPHRSQAMVGMMQHV